MKCSRFSIAELRLLAVLATIGIAALPAQSAVAEEFPIDPEKLAVLLSGQVDADPNAAFDAVAADTQFDAGAVADPKLATVARTYADQSFEFNGTGSFSLQVKTDGRAMRSYIGYVVDAPDSGHQDMVILSDLSAIGDGTHQINAACSDLHKSFPSYGMQMATRAWTSSSSSDWAYWARQAAAEGQQRGYSFDQIQASIWYISDRSGSYDALPLLRAIGYSRSGPTKNSTSTTDVFNSWDDEVGPVGCGAGLCGAGFVGAVPLTALSLCGVKVRWRRKRSNREV